MKGAIKFSTLAAAVLAASMTLYSTNAAAAGQADIDAALAAAREAVAAAQRAEAAAVEAKRAAEAAQATSVPVLVSPARVHKLDGTKIVLAV